MVTTSEWDMDIQTFTVSIGQQIFCPTVFNSGGEVPRFGHPGFSESFQVKKLFRYI